MDNAKLIELLQPTINDGDYDKFETLRYISAGKEVLDTETAKKNSQNLGLTYHITNYYLSVEQHHLDMKR